MKKPDIQFLPRCVEGRVETGVVQFGDDWPGIFIRGDNAFGFAGDLRVLLDALPAPTAETANDPHVMRSAWAAYSLRSLLALLESSRV